MSARVLLQRAIFASAILNDILSSSFQPRWTPDGSCNVLLRWSVAGLSVLDVPVAPMASPADACPTAIVIATSSPSCLVLAHHPLQLRRPLHPQQALSVCLCHDFCLYPGPWPQQSFVSLQLLLASYLDLSADNLLQDAQSFHSACTRGDLWRPLGWLLNFSPAVNGPSSHSCSFRSTQKTELPQQFQKLKTIGFLNAIKSNLRLHDVVNPQVEQTTASNSLILVHDHIPTLLKMELEGGESY